MLDFRTHTFLTAYRAGSFTRAAAELHITQPAVTQHIRHLEQHYGCTLFATSPRGITPTRAGKLLYRALSAAENDEKRLQEQLDAIAAASAVPPMRFGCTRTIADHVAPRILPRHLERHPDDHLIMRTGNTLELLELIDQGGIDVALVEGPFERARYESAVLATETLVCIAAAGTPRAARVEELLTHPLALREEGSGTREICERNLAARDLAPGDFASVTELASIPAIKACVQATPAVSFLYRITAKDELAAGTLVDITPPDLSISHDFAVLWQRGSRFAPRWRALTRIWRSYLDDARAD